MLKKTPLALTALILVLAPAFAAAGERDPQKAYQEFMAGLALEYRAEGRPDYPAAEARYQAAAEAGSREALWALARLSDPQGPLGADPQLWLRRLTAASRAGWPEAAYRLARALETGRLTSPELKPAACYLQAAAAGHGPAAFRLGELYLAGEAGLPRDESQAALWLAVAAENGEAEAALRLGRLYFQKNPEAARAWLQKADLPEALYLSGELLLNSGRFGEALKAFTRAAEAHYPPAHLALGRLNLDNDFGHRPNPREALRHLKIAAQADLPEGSYQLAHMYLAGRATPKDLITGTYWLHRAARAGHQPAASEMEKIVRNLSVGQKKRLDRMIEDGPVSPARPPEADGPAESPPD